MKQGGLMVSQKLSYSKDATKKLLENDKLLTFYFNLLTTKENKTEEEALKIIYEKQILDDPYRASEYFKNRI